MNKFWLNASVTYADPDYLQLGGSARSGVVCHIFNAHEKPDPLWTEACYGQHAVKSTHRLIYSVSRLVIFQAESKSYMVVPQPRWKYVKRSIL
jgi:hypothetical protein